jgi:large subunit ribosomal protein L36e
MEQKTGMFVGLNKGFVVTKPAQKDSAFRAAKSHRKGRIHPRIQGVREVVSEICGLMPFERKMVELIKTGIPSKEKRSVKLARRKLGTIRRAKNKKQQIDTYLLIQSRKK